MKVILTEQVEPFEKLFISKVDETNGLLEKGIKKCNQILKKYPKDALRDQPLTTVCEIIEMIGLSWKDISDARKQFTALEIEFGQMYAKSGEVDVEKAMKIYN